VSRGGRFGSNNSNYEHLGTVEIEIAIGVEILEFFAISVPIPIRIPITAAIMRIVGLEGGRCRC